MADRIEVLEVRMAETRRVVIMGAAGRDFHNFNVVYRDLAGARVVAFTAAQIPGIEGRRYPPALAGPFYPDGIPIEEETNLERICREESVDEVVFSYSDVPHAEVMHAASRALAAGADFTLLGPTRTMLPSKRPVFAVCAVRTGAGKSQVARWLVRRLRDRGLRVATVRHPMPYGDLESQRAQRFASYEDLEAASCTIEEREEYEPHLAAGSVVFAGVDYAEILARAEAEADVVVWDGGNNDFPFFRPDLHVVLVDALRPTDASSYHPGEATLRMADVVVVSKVDAASHAQVEQAETSARALAPNATIVRGASPVLLEDPEAVRDQRVLVVDDGPTLTHGGMRYGAGYVAAVAAGARTIVDPRPYAAAPIREVIGRYPHLASVLPALGYGAEQLEALRETIAATPADVVVSGTPIDLGALIDVGRPIVRAHYEFAEAGEPGLGTAVDAACERLGLSA